MTRPSSSLFGAQIIFGACAFLSVLSCSTAANAALITFIDNDPTGVVLEIDGTAGRAPLNCTSIPGECFGNLTAPVGLVSAQSGQSIYIGESGTEALSGFVSDRIDISTTVGATTIFLVFRTEFPAGSGNLGTCVGVGGCSITENGAIQQALTLNWMNPAGGPIVASDIIQFQSDAHGTPEPAALALSGAGLVLFGLWRKKLYKTKGVTR